MFDHDSINELTQNLQKAKVTTSFVRNNNNNNYKPYNDSKQILFIEYLRYSIS